jgi:hypothetical protein
MIPGAKRVARPEASRRQRRLGSRAKPLMWPNNRSSPSGQLAPWGVAVASGSTGSAWALQSHL